MNFGGGHEAWIVNPSQAEQVGKVSENPNQRQHTPYYQHQPITGEQASIIISNALSPLSLQRAALELVVEFSPSLSWIRRLKRENGGIHDGGEERKKTAVKMWALGVP